MNFSSKYLAVIILLLLMFSCKSLPDNPPIPMDKMSKIILDMQIAEVYSQGLGDSVKNKFEKNYDSLDAFYVSILKHHSISYEDFNDAMEWYKNHPVLMDSMLGGVNRELTVVKKKENIKDASVLPDQPNPYTNGKPKMDSLIKVDNLHKTDSIAKADSLKAIKIKDSLANKNKIKVKVKTSDSVHKKKPFIKTEP